MATWAIDRGRSDVTALGVVVDVKQGYTHVCTLPAGTKITHHPSGNGVIAVHPDHPPKWIKRDGTVMEIVPSSTCAGVWVDRKREWIGGPPAPVSEQTEANVRSFRPYVARAPSLTRACAKLGR